MASETGDRRAGARRWAEIVLSPGPGDGDGDGRERSGRLERAAAEGFDGVWLSAPDAARAAGLLHAAASAAASCPLAIAAGTLPLPTHHPLRIAEDAASLDALAAGRLALAFLATDAAAAAEDLAVLRAAWSERPVSHAGARHRFENVDVHPKPARPGGPELWLDASASGDESGSRALQPAEAMALALSEGLGLVAGDVAAVRAFLEGWERAGRPPEAARVALRVTAPSDGVGSEPAGIDADLAGDPRVDLLCRLCLEGDPGAR